MHHISDTVDEYYCLVCDISYIPGKNDPLTLAKTAVRVINKHEESDMQQAVIEWANICKYKEILDYLHHSPNGGARDEREGARFKREGVRKGYPDLELNVSRKGYHGLFIEMKTAKGRLSTAQKKWKKFLLEEGNSWHLCRSAEEAIEIIEWYLG